MCLFTKRKEEIEATCTLFALQLYIVVLLDGILSYRNGLKSQLLKTFSVCNTMRHSQQGDGSAESSGESVYIMIILLRHVDINTLQVCCPIHFTYSRPLWQNHTQNHIVRQFCRYETDFWLSRSMNSTSQIVFTTLKVSRLHQSCSCVCSINLKDVCDPDPDNPQLQ